MATTGVYNRFKLNDLGSTDLSADTFGVLLVSSGYTFNPDHNVVTDITNELSGTGYVRKTLTSTTLTEDDTNDRSIFSAANLTYTGANFGTADAAIVYREPPSSPTDATRELVCCLDLTPKSPTNSGPLNVNWAATIGILRTITSSQVYNRGKQKISDGVDLTSADVRVLLVSSSYTYDPDHNFVSDLTNELSGTGYSRQALTGKSIVEDDTNDWATFDANDVSWPAANFGTPAKAILYIEAATDATRELIAAITISSPIVTNGGSFDVAWSANGILRVT